MSAYSCDMQSNVISRNQRAKFVITQQSTRDSLVIRDGERMTLSEMTIVLGTPTVLISDEPTRDDK